MDRLYIIGKDPVPRRIVLSKPGESLSLTLAVLPGVSCELAMQIDLDAEGCSVDLAGLYVCKGDENVRLDINLRHNVPGCKSRQLFKGVVGGSARAEFDGLVYVARDAQQTEAYQENHSLLLSPEAVCETHPSLRSTPTMSNAPTEPRPAISILTSSSTCAPAVSPRRKRGVCR